MKDSIKHIIDNEINNKTVDALYVAIKAIYFNDNSDYLSSLYEIVEELLEHETPELMDDSFIKEVFNYINGEE